MCGTGPRLSGLLSETGRELAAWNPFPPNFIDTGDTATNQPDPRIGVEGYAVLCWSGDVRKWCHRQGLVVE